MYKCLDVVTEKLRRRWSKAEAYDLREAPSDDENCTSAGDRIYNRDVASHDARMAGRGIRAHRRRSSSAGLSRGSGKRVEGVAHSENPVAEFFGAAHSVNPSRDVTIPETGSTSTEAHARADRVRVCLGHTLLHIVLTQNGAHRSRGCWSGTHHRSAKDVTNVIETSPIAPQVAVN
jgi:hypothetical protein